MFHILLLESDILRSKVIDQKFANQFKLGEEEQSEQEVDLILDIMIFVKKVLVYGFLA